MAKDRLKILITSDWYKPVINGVVTSVLSLADGLKDLGAEVRILTLSGTIHSYQDGNVTYIGSVGVGKIYPNARIRTAMTHRYVKELVAWKPDIVHSQCEFSTFFIARHIARTCNVPFVHTYHTVYEDYTHYFSPSRRVGKAIATSFSRRILNQTQLVIAPTEKVREMLLRYEVDPPVVTIPSGLELTNFPCVISKEMRSQLRRELGISDTAPVLIYVGRLAREKNIEELFTLLKNSDLETRLLLVGDGPYRSALESLAEKMDLTERVVFAGMVSPNEVSHYYTVGDVFVSASQSETQGLTYIEAMACGLPILCKADVCLNDVVNNGVNGYIYNDREEFERIAERLLSDFELRRKIGQQASENIRKRYSSEQFAGSALKAYHQALESNNGVSGTLLVRTDPAE